MQKLLLRLSPLFLLLLVFSCAKDQDLIPAEQQERTQIEARLEGEDKGKPCYLPCRQPDFINVSSITGCSATLSFGFETKVCGTFAVQLQNLATGEWTYFNSATSPLNLTDLAPCTNYTVGVSHITELCASIPLKVSFQTECRKCKECLISCRPPDYLYATNITTNSATITFGHENEVCGKFMARLTNNSTGAITYIDPANSPLNLSDLDPCTSYTIGISHVTDWQACIFSELSFTTECEDYCDAEGLDPDCLNGDYISLSLDQHPGVWNTNDTDGYVDALDQIVVINPGQVLDWTPVGITICEGIAGEALFMNLWIDFDDDGEFETSEEIYDHTLPNGWGWGGIDVPISPGFQTPNEELCGLRARFIVSTDPDASPCGNVAVGQVIDFTVNLGDCID